MTHTKVSKIVVGFDYSPIGELALTRAFEVAAKEENGEVHVVTVVMLGDDVGAGIAGVPVYPTTSVDSAHQALENRVTELADAWRKKTGRHFQGLACHIRVEAPASEIAQLAVDLEATLIVVGTHGRRGFQRLLLGSVAEGVVRQAHCEVLIVRPVVPEPEVPRIEPPCPRCVDARKESAGKEYWCEQHRERHGQRHTYHYTNRAAQSGNISGLVGTR